jgi:hypothetical protein
MHPSRPIVPSPQKLQPLRVLATAFAALVATGAGAQSAAPARPSPCAAPEHRQFDFWIGTWDVFGPAGRKVGENRIERIAGGCALLEQWTGSGNVTGKSLNIYDVSDGRWHQTWVDSSGTLLMLAGGVAEASMVMSASTPSASDPKTTVTQRITWTPAADGSVRQLWETSKDGGQTWAVAFDGRYVRVK